jgi:hypothetical protein
MQQLINDTYQAVTEELSPDLAQAFTAGDAAGVSQVCEQVQLAAEVLDAAFNKLGLKQQTQLWVQVGVECWGWGWGRGPGHHSGLLLRHMWILFYASWEAAMPQGDATCVPGAHTVLCWLLWVSSARSYVGAGTSCTTHAC